MTENPPQNDVLLQDNNIGQNRPSATRHQRHHSSSTDLDDYSASDHLKILINDSVKKHFSKKPSSSTDVDKINKKRKNSGFAQKASEISWKH
uniref:Uncharacterized protein n=1 Tax=Romanomermis culicivorax TaxID=13658 RepID=A0A915JZU0_ROMCU